MRQPPPDRRPPTGSRPTSPGRTSVVTRDRLCSWPRVRGDLPGQLPPIEAPCRTDAEELPRHLGPDPGPLSRRDRASCRPSDGGVERGDALATSTRNGRRSLSTILNGDPAATFEILLGEVGSLQRAAQLGQRMETAAEQGRICSAVTGSPAASPSIPSIPEPIHIPVSHPVRCSTTPAQCDPSQSRPTPPPAGSDSHTQTRR